MAMKTSRKVNIELLRIVSMLGITALHYLYWNDAILLTTNTVTPLRTAGSVIESLCIPSVACYVLISGYCDRSTQFRPRRLVRLLAQVWFWSVLLHVALSVIGIAEPAVSVWDLANYFLPIMSGHYWFASAFVVMEILAPLLNAGAAQVSRKTLQGVIGAFLIYESVIKTILPFQLNQDEMGYDFGFFLLLFLIGVYLRIYGVPGWLNSRGKALTGYLASCGVIALVQIGASVLHARTGSLSWLMSSPFHYNYLFAVTGSVCLFLVFVQWEMGEARTGRKAVAASEHVQTDSAAGESGGGLQEGRFLRVVRGAAPLTFGVYLIQCHQDLLSRWPVWMASLAGQSAETANPVVFFLWMAAAVAMVFALCCALDAVRAVLFDRVPMLRRTL